MASMHRLLCAARQNTQGIYNSISRTVFFGRPSLRQPSFFNSRSKRSYTSYGDHSFNYTSNMRTIWAVIGANTLVFGAWQYSLPSGPTQLLPNAANHKMARFLTENFITSIHAIRSGRFWTSLTSAFSHISPMHFLGNMVAMYAFASVLARHPAVNPFRMIALVLGSAVTGSAGFYMHSSTRPYGSQINGLGASGVVMGLGGAAALLYPRAPMLLYGFIPVPLWALIGGYIFLDSYYLNDSRSRTAHSGHLGGLGFGLVYALLKLRKRRW